MKETNRIPEEDRGLRMSLMGELETSLHRSRSAILLRDLARLTDETARQIGLLRDLSGAMQRDARSLPGGNREFQQSCMKVMQAARVQAALVSRARGRLWVLRNMLRGPSVIYGPMDWPGGSEGNLTCRA